MRAASVGAWTWFWPKYERTFIAANNYAASLNNLRRFDEAKSVLCKMIPVARRVLGGNHDFTLKMRMSYAMALYRDADATLDDIREAVTTLEDAERIARRVLGDAHPTVVGIETCLQEARPERDARETPSEAV